VAGRSRLVALAVAAGLASGTLASAESECRRYRGRIDTYSVSPTEQQGTVLFVGRKPEGFRTATLRGHDLVLLPGGTATLSHDLVFTNKDRPMAAVFTAGDEVALASTADPCVLDVVETPHFVRATGAFAAYDLDRSTAEVVGTLDVCTGENRFDIALTLCRTAAAPATRDER
jgi:hypothetical protein